MSPTRTHDTQPGPLDYCQVCFSQDLELVVDLGHQPLCDSLLTSEMLAQPETFYPLRLVRCKTCTLTQLDYVVPGDVVYHRAYPYRAGITREVVEHHTESAAALVRTFGLGDRSLVVDIGCNDGTLLGAIKKHGVRVAGVEPTDIAKIARDNGIDVVQAPFTEEVATELRRTRGAASLLTATNVFAHMAPLGEVMRAARALLADGGTFMTETHYLVDVLKGVQYDTIYHEHLRTYSLRSLVSLFEQYGFTVVDAYRVERYAGTLRVFARKERGARPSENVSTLLEEERAFGLEGPDVYATFRRRTYEARNAMLEFLLKCQREGRRVVGNSCPGRCSTLLNFSDVTPDMMPYIAEQPTSLKLGLFLPGKHIPIVNNEVLFREQPDVVILLAWHYAGPIRKLLREAGLRSTLVVPLPTFRALED